MLEVVLVGLGVPEMRNTITGLQQQNSVLQQQIQNLHIQTEQVSNDLQTNSTTLERLEQQQTEQVNKIEEKVTKSVEGSLQKV